tara:strand:+ start:216 stop:410 length:195 start_codon:yes stop_codon:yes gene_type:complete
MMVSFTKKELDLIIDIIGVQFIDIYEERWFNNKISDKEFDEIVKVVTKLGYTVASRKQMEEEFD